MLYGLSGVVLLPRLLGLYFEQCLRRVVARHQRRLVDLVHEFARTIQPDRTGDLACNEVIQIGIGRTARTEIQRSRRLEEESVLKHAVLALAPESRTGSIAGRPKREEMGVLVTERV